MRFSFKGMSLLPALALAVGLVALPATAASADTTVTLPITNFDGMAVDSALGYLFFSEGTTDYSTTDGSNAILVTNLDGDPVATIPGLDGVKGLALSPDGSTLYAALSSDDEIRAFSTTTLKQTAVYNLDPPQGSTYTPYGLAIEDGIIWVSYMFDRNVGLSSIGYINPAAANPTFVPQGLGGTWYYPPQLAVDPANTSAVSKTGTIVACGPNTDPTQLNSFQMAGTTVTSSASSAQSETGCSPFSALAVLPGGSQFVDGDTLYNTPDLTATSQTYLGGGVAAVATDGTVAMGGENWYGVGSGVYVDPSGATTATPPHG